VFTVDEASLGCSRDALIATLGADDIEARPVWKPMHLQKLYADCAMYGGSVAEDLFARGICLPSGSSLTDEEQERVVGVIARAARAGGAA
jgi:pyridoxal phosphate-dependent aminotransferase EpsN